MQKQHRTENSFHIIAEPKCDICYILLHDREDVVETYEIDHLKLLPENCVMMFNDIYYLQFNFLHNISFIVHALHLNKKEKSLLGTFENNNFQTVINDHFHQA